MLGLVVWFKLKQNELARMTRRQSAKATRQSSNVGNGSSLRGGYLQFGDGKPFERAGQEIRTRVRRQLTQNKNEPISVYF